MVNGVMSIVAAVLFAVVALQEGMNMIWLTIAGIYLVWGILNLVVYAVKNHRKQKSAQQALKKAEEKAAQREAEKTAVKLEEKPVQKPVEVIPEQPLESAAIVEV